MLLEGKSKVKALADSMSEEGFLLRRWCPLAESYTAEEGEK
jgi:hypothetical protein